MRVLIIGVTGQVGGALLKVLGPQVRGLGGSIVATGRDSLDLAQPDRVASSLERIAPDLIVNPAAYTAVDRAEDERDLVFRINAEAPGAIARWAARREVPLIHFSTDYVFDGSGDRPWLEDDPANPLSVYGASKLAGDEAVRAAGGAHLIVRTSWVYAATGKNFLRTIVRLATERKELRVVDDQIGAPTSAALIADAIASMIGVDAAGLTNRFAASGGVVNLAASGETSWHGFAAAIVDALKARGVSLAVETITPIATKDYPTKAKRPFNSRLDLTRLREVFQLDPARWAEALDVELDHVAAEPVGDATLPETYPESKPGRPL
jgi:dTDP-4-dehydrorhamnose reductase